MKSPRAYGELIAAGARPHQIPPWIVRPGGETDKTPKKSGEPMGDTADPPVKSSDTLIEPEEPPPLRARVPKVAASVAYMTG